VLVGDHRDQAADQRQLDVLADQALVALVVRVDRDCSVGEHRLGPHRRHHELAGVLALERVADLVDRVVDLAFSTSRSRIADCVPGSQLTM